MAKTATQLDREIAEALSKKKTKRWVHRDVAHANDVAEDVVRRIYAAVQTAKKQGLHGGYAVDLVERMVGRKLMAGEYTVASKARTHLGYAPPGGYGGPKPRGSAKEPARAAYDDPSIVRAKQLIASADAVIRDLAAKDRPWGLDEARVRGRLQQVADELDVAADLYEEAGAKVRAGTIRARANLARQGNYAQLRTYDT